jgi:hypothetical protein
MEPKAVSRRNLPAVNRFLLSAIAFDDQLLAIRRSRDRAMLFSIKRLCAMVYLTAPEASPEVETQKLLCRFA